MAQNQIVVSYCPKQSCLQQLKQQKQPSKSRRRQKAAQSERKVSVFFKQGNKFIDHEPYIRPYISRYSQIREKLLPSLLSEPESKWYDMIVGMLEKQSQRQSGLSIRKRKKYQQQREQDTILQSDDLCEGVFGNGGGYADKKIIPMIEKKHKQQSKLLVKQKCQQCQEQQQKNKQSELELKEYVQELERDLQSSSFGMVTVFQDSQGQFQIKYDLAAYQQKIDKIFLDNYCQFPSVSEFNKLPVNENKDHISSYDRQKLKAIYAMGLELETTIFILEDYIQEYYHKLDQNQQQYKSRLFQWYLRQLKQEEEEQQQQKISVKSKNSAQIQSLYNNSIQNYCTAPKNAQLQAYQLFQSQQQQPQTQYQSIEYMQHQQEEQKQQQLLKLQNLGRIKTED